MEDLIDKNVGVLTFDAKYFTGELKGFDVQSSNIILYNCKQVVKTSAEKTEEIALGLYIIRGSNLALVGELDEEKYAALGDKKVAGAELKVIRH